MVLKIFFSVLCVFVCHLFAINVEFYDEQCNNESNTTIRIRVTNDSKETIKNVKLRYYFHNVENKNVVINSYYIVNAEVLWKELNSSLAYLDIKIDSIPPGVYPNASGFSIGLHYSDWSVWNKATDYDNDGIRAEKDPDSDGGGIIDGLEDLNSNGLYDNGESIVLDERDDVRDHLILDIPDDYTLYALGSLRINDGVKCYNRIDEDKPSCKVASFESSLLKTFFPNRYSLVLGARSFIGSADSRGTVFIRSGAHVYGNLNVYVMANPAAFYEISGASLNLNDYLTSQASSVIYGSSSLQYVGDWPNSYLFSLPDKINGKGKIVVKSGETFYLRDDFACDTLKVENGATLVVEPGEMYVDSLLLLEADSRIEFSQPGVSSVLHIAGNCIWRPYRSESITDLNYWTSVAKGFKMIQHSSKKLFIEGPWGGTIYAPLSELILGQATKAVYGRFLGKKITVHQYTKVFRVDFVPNISLEVAQLKRGSGK